MLLKDNKGFALVIVLLIFSVLVGIVTEFVYVVHNETVSLYNWRESQRLSLEAQSGIKVGEAFLKEILDRFTYSYPGRVDLPVPDIAGDGRDAMLITVIDENGKLNINMIVNTNRRTEHIFLFPSFKRLLGHLDIDVTIADRILDWIDTDSEERVRDSEIDAKNGYLYSIDELLNIEGITDEIYQKLLPHVTIFGEDSPGLNALVNINSADKYVLMSLSDDINEELAKRIINYRELKPFEYPTDIQKVAGFSDGLGTSLGGHITVEGLAFTVKVNVMMDKLTRTVTAVISFATGRPEYKYWKET